MNEQTGTDGMIIGIQISEHEWFFPNTLVVYNDETGEFSVPEVVPVDVNE